MQTCFVYISWVIFVKGDKEQQNSKPRFSAKGSWPIYILFAIIKHHHNNLHHHLHDSSYCSYFIIIIFYTFPYTAYIIIIPFLPPPPPLLLFPRFFIKLTNAKRIARDSYKTFIG